MKVFMLGWEFPPYISGGLGTACYGLTKALDEIGVEVAFVLPTPVPSDAPTHVKLRTPQDLPGGAKPTVEASQPGTADKDFDNVDPSSDGQWGTLFTKTGSDGPRIVLELPQKHPGGTSTSTSTASYHARR